MECVFKDAGVATSIETYPLKDEVELMFVIECLAIRKMNAELIISPSMIFAQEVLVQLPFAETKNGKLILHAEKISMADKIMVDASAFPAAVFGLSAMFAATGMEADITGLESLSTGKELEQVTCLQRMLYRLNINTDYCGGSKFKVYNNKQMRAGLNLKPSVASFPWLLLVPAVIKTGELRMDIEENDLKDKMELIEAGGIERV